MSSDGFRKIAEHHLPNRILIAAEDKISADKLFSMLPIRCHWCERERPLSKLQVSSSFELECRDTKVCNKKRTKALYERYPKLKERQNAAKAKKKAKSGKSSGKTAKAENKPSEPVSDEICGIKHKAPDKKLRKCIRKPGHKGQHKDRKDNRW